MLSLLKKVSLQSIPRKQRENVEPTFYPKRNQTDSIIDWEQDVFQIDAHIRAVSRPFGDAYTYVRGHKFTIAEASVFETNMVDFGQEGEPWGTVLQVFYHGSCLVACRGGILFVPSAFLLETGDRLYTPDDHSHQTFERNKLGYHDI